MALVFEPSAEFVTAEERKNPVLRHLRNAISGSDAWARIAARDLPWHLAYESVVHMGTDTSTLQPLQ